MHAEDISEKTQSKHLCLIHLYGSKYSLSEFSSYVSVCDEIEYKRQIGAARKIVKRALNAIEDDIFDYASTFRSKRQRSQIGKGGANTKLINVVASTSTPTPEKEKKKEGNTGNVNSNESTLLNKSSEKMKESRRENIWKTASIEKKSKSSKSTNHVELKITGLEFKGMVFDDVKVPSFQSRKNSAVMLRTAISYSQKISTDEDLRRLSRISLSIENHLFRAYPFIENSSAGSENFNIKNAENRKTYMKRIRLLYTNIKDERNSSLRQKIIGGEVSIEGLCSGNAESIMNPETREARKRSQQKLMLQRTRTGISQTDEGIKTDDYQCPLCSNTTKNTILLVSTSRHVGKCETWGNKDTQDAQTSRIICSKCDHEFFR